MTKEEYAEYEQSVASFFEREGVTNLSRRYFPFTDDDDCEEEYFSWRRCECCGTRLGGNRLMASGYNPETKEVYEYEICSDCEYYAEYGQLDDMTMMDIEMDIEKEN